MNKIINKQHFIKVSKTQKVPFKAITLLSVISILLVGCGFKLRGTGISLPEIFKKTYLVFSGNQNDYLNTKVRSLININGGNIVDKIASEVQVNISAIDLKSRQIALSGDFALKEYENTYSINVSVTDTQAGLQLGSRQLSTTEYIQLNDKKILAGEEQSSVTKKIASRKLANLTIQYLETF